MLRHFFHDERIANHITHYFRCIESGLLTQDRALIKFHEHHQPRSAKLLMDHTFKFSKGGRGMHCLHELDHIWMANSLKTSSNGLEDMTLSLSISTFLTVMFSVCEDKSHFFILYIPR